MVLEPRHNAAPAVVGCVIEQLQIAGIRARSAMVITATMEHALSQDSSGCKLHRFGIDATKR